MFFSRSLDFLGKTTKNKTSWWMSILKLRRLVSTLLRKAGYACRPFLGGTWFELRLLRRSQIPFISRYNKKGTPYGIPFCWNCGDRIWTCDLRVMSPTSYRTALLRVSKKEWAEKDSNLRSYRNRFTVCPLWPLGNPPTKEKSRWSDSNR